MKTILLTNDDGIKSEGILKLAHVLREENKGRIIILAPDSDRSGVSHGLSIMTRPMKLTKESEDVWTCTGLPVDCVLAAVMGALPCKPDMIISGINRGANMGNDIIYSGTAAAARQGALMGIPSIAISLSRTKVYNETEVYNWEMAAQYSSDHLDEFLGMWEKDIFINVNIPNSAQGPLGMAKNTVPARKDYHDSLTVFKGPEGEDWCFLNPGKDSAEEDSESDWDAVSRNLVSISPVSIFPAIKRGGE